MTPNPQPRPPHSGRRTVRVGVLLLLGAVGLAFTPLVISLEEWSKYPVAFGCAGALLGGSLILNGLIDVLRGKG